MFEQLVDTKLPQMLRHQTPYGFLSFMAYVYAPGAIAALQRVLKSPSCRAVAAANAKLFNVVRSEKAYIREGRRYLASDFETGFVPKVIYYV